MFVYPSIGLSVCLPVSLSVCISHSHSLPRWSTFKDPRAKTLAPQIISTARRTECTRFNTLPRQWKKSRRTAIITLLPCTALTIHTSFISAYMSIGLMAANSLPRCTFYEPSSLESSSRANSVNVAVFINGHHGHRKRIWRMGIAF